MIHIQDLHVRYEAQSNIASLLELLHHRLGVSLIAVEGGQGPCETEVFAAFPEKQINRKIATLFLKEGLFTGAEYQAIVQPHTLTLYGVEDQGTYFEHLKTYQATQPNKSQVEEALGHLKTALGVLQDQLYPATIRELERKTASYEEEHLGFSEYLEHLFWLAGWNEIPVDDYPTLAKFRRLIDLEQKVNTQAAEDERLDLLRWLAGTAEPADYEDLLKRSVDYREKRLSPTDYFTYLKRLARRYGVDLVPSSEFPHLAYYISYVSLSERLDYQKLTQELKQLQSILSEKLLTSPEQRELAKLSKLAQILNGLYHVRLTNEDMAYYTAHKSEMSTESFQAFFKHYHKWLAKSSKAAPATLQTDLAFLFEHLPQQERFYHLAMTRDTTLVENTLRLLQERKQQAAILIAGGFHTKGLTQLLKERNVAYVVITPRTEEKMDETLYTSLLLNQVPTIPQLLDKLNGTALIQPLATSPTGDQVEVNTKGPDPFLKQDKDKKGKGPSKRTFVLLAWAILQIAQLVSSGWKEADVLRLFQQPELTYAYEVDASKGFQTLAVNGTKVELAFNAQGLPVARVVEEVVRPTARASSQVGSRSTPAAPPSPPKPAPTPEKLLPTTATPVHPPSITPSTMPSPSFVQRTKGAVAKTVLALALFFGLSSLSPNVSQAAQFFTQVNPSTQQTQVMAKVEKSDTLWGISGEAHKDMVGPRKYAAHVQWPNIYQANPKIQGRPGERMQPPGYERVVIQPGDKLVIPGEIGKDINPEVVKGQPEEVQVGEVATINAQIKALEQEKLDVLLKKIHQQVISQPRGRTYQKESEKVITQGPEVRAFIQKLNKVFDAKVGVAQLNGKINPFTKRTYRLDLKRFNWDETLKHDRYDWQKEAAVIAFQMAYRIPEDGDVGPLTRVKVIDLEIDQLRKQLSKVEEKAPEAEKLPVVKAPEKKPEAPKEEIKPAESERVEAEKLQQERRQLEQRLGQLVTEMHSAEQQIRALRGKIGELVTETKQAEAKKQTLLGEVQQLEARLGVLSQQRTSLEEDLKQGATAVEDQQRQIGHAQAQLASLKKQIEQADQKLIQLLKEKEAAEKEVVSAKPWWQHWEALAAILGALGLGGGLGWWLARRRAKPPELPPDEQAKQAAQTLQALRAQVAQAEQELRETSQKASDARQQLTTLEEQRAQAEQALAEANAKLAEAQKLSASEQQQLSQQKAVVEREISDLSTKKEGLTRELADVEQKLTEGKAALEKVRADLQTVAEQKTVAQADVDRLKRDQEELRKMLENLRRENEELTTVVERLRAEAAAGPPPVEKPLPVAPLVPRVVGPPPPVSLAELTPEQLALAQQRRLAYLEVMSQIPERLPLDLPPEDIHHRYQGLVAQIEAAPLTDDQKHRLRSELDRQVALLGGAREVKKGQLPAFQAGVRHLGFGDNVAQFDQDAVSIAGTYRELDPALVKEALEMARAQVLARQEARLAREQAQQAQAALDAEREAKAKELEQQRRQHEAELARLRDELGQLRQQLAVAGAPSEVVVFRRVIEQLERRRAELQQKLVTALQGEMNSLRQREADLRRQFAPALRPQIDELRQRHEALQERIEEIKRRYQQQYQELADALAGIQTWPFGERQARLEELEAQLTRLDETVPGEWQAGVEPQRNQAIQAMEETRRFITTMPPAPEVVTPAPLPAPVITVPALQRALMRTPVPDGVWRQLEEQFGLPRTAIERVLAERSQASRDVEELIKTLADHDSIQAKLMTERNAAYREVQTAVPRLIAELESASPRAPPPIPIGDGTYQLVLSPGEPQDLLRGYFSGDCTNCGFAETFEKYLPAHLLSPGFLNFRVIHASDGKWVGTVYAVVVKAQDETALLIDAIQIPWKDIRPGPPPHGDGLELFPETAEFARDKFPITFAEAKQIADGVIGALTAYAQAKGFQAVWLGFVSNFIPFVSYYHQKYRGQFVLDQGQSRGRILATLKPIDDNLVGFVNSFDEFLDPGQTMPNRGFIRVWATPLPPVIVPDELRELVEQPAIRQLVEKSLRHINKLQGRQRPEEPDTIYWLRDTIWRGSRSLQAYRLEYMGEGEWALLSSERPSPDYERHAIRTFFGISKQEGIVAPGTKPLTEVAVRDRPNNAPEKALREIGIGLPFPQAGLVLYEPSSGQFVAKEFIHKGQIVEDIADPVTLERTQTKRRLFALPTVQHDKDYPQFFDVNPYDEVLTQTPGKGIILRWHYEPTRQTPEEVVKRDLTNDLLVVKGLLPVTNRVGVLARELIESGEIQNRRKAPYLLIATDTDVKLFEVRLDFSKHGLPTIEEVVDRSKWLGGWRQQLLEIIRGEPEEGGSAPAGHTPIEPVSPTPVTKPAPPRREPVPSPALVAQPPVTKELRNRINRLIDDLRSEGTYLDEVVQATQKHGGISRSLSKVPFDRSHTMDELISIGRPAVEPVRQALAEAERSLQSDSTTVRSLLIRQWRLKFAYLLTELGDDQGLETLLKAAQDEYTHLAVILALDLLEQPQALSPLLHVYARHGEQNLIRIPQLLNAMYRAFGKLLPTVVPDQRFVEQVRRAAIREEKRAIKELRVVVRLEQEPQRTIARQILAGLGVAETNPTFGQKIKGWLGRGGTSRMLMIGVLTSALWLSSAQALLAQTQVPEEHLIRQKQQEELLKRQQIPEAWRKQSEPRKPEERRVEEEKRLPPLEEKRLEDVRGPKQAVQEQARQEAEQHKKEEAAETARKAEEIRRQQQQEQREKESARKAEERQGELERREAWEGFKETAWTILKWGFLGGLGIGLLALFGAILRGLVRNAKPIASGLWKTTKFLVKSPWYLLKYVLLVPAKFLLVDTPRFLAKEVRTRGIVAETLTVLIGTAAVVAFATYHILTYQEISSLTAPSTSHLIQRLTNVYGTVRGVVLTWLGFLTAGAAARYAILRMKDKTPSGAALFLLVVLAVASGFGTYKLTKALEEQAALMRQGTARQLGDLGDPAAVPALIKALHDPDAWVRENAAEALGNLKDARAVPALIEALNDDSSYVRNRAAFALSALGVMESSRDPDLLAKLLSANGSLHAEVVDAFVRIGELAVPTLIQMLRGDSPGTAAEALTRLGVAGSQRAMDAVSIQAMRDEDWRVKQAAHVALSSRGISTPEGRIIELINANDEAGLVNEGRQAAVEVLVSALRSNDGSMRNKDLLARVLGLIGDRRAAGPIAQALQESQISVATAAEALGRLRDPQSIEPLLQAASRLKWPLSYWDNPPEKEIEAIVQALLAIRQIDHALLEEAIEDDNKAVRAVAARVLSGLESREMADLLIQALDDQDIRLTAIEGLSRLREAKAAQPLAKLLTLPDSEYTRGARQKDWLESSGKDQVVKALVGIGQPAAQALVEVLDDERAGSRAGDALIQIGQPAIPALMERLNHWHPASRRQAIELFARIGQPAIPALIQAFASDAWFIREGSLQALLGMTEPQAAVDQLIPALEHSDWNVRWRAAIALAQIFTQAPDPRAVPPLIQLLDDPEPQARKAAATALGFTVGDLRAVAPLMRRFTDPDPLVRKASVLSAGKVLRSFQVLPEEVSQIVSLLEDTDWRVRAAAVRVLGGIDDPVIALPALLRDARADVHPFVRREVAFALGRIQDPRATDELLRLLSDPDVSVQLAAAQSLDQIRDTLADDFLLRRLLDENPDTRNAAVEELKRTRNPQTTYRLVRALTDSFLPNSERAASALKELGETGITALVVGLESQDPSVHVAAQSLLKKLGEPATSALVEALQSDNPFVRQTSADALIAIGVPSEPALYQAAWDTSNPELSGLAVAVLWEIDYLKSQQVHQNLRFRYVTWPAMVDLAKQYGPYYLLIIGLLGGTLGASQFLREYRRRSQRQGSSIFRRVEQGQAPVPVATVTRSGDGRLLLGNPTGRQGRVGEDHVKLLQWALGELSGLGYVDAIRQARRMTIVTGNDRLAHTDSLAADITIDLDAFQSSHLLLMELEHELQHLTMAQLRQRAPPAVEELAILRQEIRRFLSFTPSQQDEVLRALQEVEVTDSEDRMFARVLTRARSTGLENIGPSLIAYVEKAYAEEAKAGLPGKAPDRAILSSLGQASKETVENLWDELRAIRLRELLQRRHSIEPRVAQLMVTLHRKLMEDSRTRRLGERRREPYQFTLRELRKWAEFFQRYRREWGDARAFISGAIYIYRDRLESPQDRERCDERVKELDFDPLLADGRPGDMEVLLSDAPAQRSGVSSYGARVRIRNTSLPINPEAAAAAYVPDEQAARLVHIPRTERDLEKLAQAVELNDPVLLAGETGVGKTALVRHLAYLTRNSFRRFNLNGQTDKLEFIGGFRPSRRLLTREQAMALARQLAASGSEEDQRKLASGVQQVTGDPVSPDRARLMMQDAVSRRRWELIIRIAEAVAQAEKAQGQPEPFRFEWKEGILVEAMRHGYWLLLDEINLAEPEVIERIRYLLEPQGHLVISEHEGEHWIPASEYDRRIADIIASLGPGDPAQLAHQAMQELERRRVFRIHPSFRLFATMNPPEYEGRKPLSPALMNKFRVKWIEELSQEDIARILRAKYHFDPEIALEVLKLHQGVRELGGEEGELGRELGQPYRFTIRQLFRLADRLQDWLAQHPKSPPREATIGRLVQEASEVYGDSLQTARDRAIFQDFLAKTFGAQPPEQEPEVRSDSQQGLVHFGDVSLPLNRQEGPSVPGTSSRLMLIPSTKRSLRSLARAIQMREPLLLVGPTGSAKTSLLKYLAHLTETGFDRVNLDVQTDTGELIGRYVPVEGKAGDFVWKDGTLVEALRKGHWILLDEFNLADPEILERINSLLDEDGYLVLTEHDNEVVRPHPNFRLFAAMNPERYAGRNRLSMAMRNKFTEKWLTAELPKEELREILAFYLTDQEVMSEPPVGAGQAGLMAELMADVHEQVLAAIREHKLGQVSLSAGDAGNYHFSLRDLKDWAEFIRRLSGQLGAAVLDQMIGVTQNEIDRIGEDLRKDSTSPLKRQALEEQLKRHQEALALAAQERADPDALKRWGTARALIEGALYVYRDRLQGMEDRSLFEEGFLPHVFTQEKQEALGGEVVDIGKLLALERPTKGVTEMIQQKEAVDLEMLELTERFDALTVGFRHGLRPGLAAIRQFLMTPGQEDQGVRGFALLPSRIAEGLVELAIESAKPKVRQAAIEVVGHLRLKTFIGAVEQLLVDEHQPIRLTAAIVLERMEWTEWKKHAIPRLTTRPDKLPFRQTIGQLIRPAKGELQGDYLGLFRFLRRPLTLLSIGLISLTIAVFGTPFLLGSYGYTVWLSRLTYIGVFSVGVGGLWVGLRELFRAAYGVIYLPQYLVLAARYRALPLDLEDFYALLQPMEGKRFIHFGLAAEEQRNVLARPASRAFLLVSSAIGSVAAVALLAGAGADSLPLIPTWLGWPPLLRFAGLLAGSGFGYFTAGFMILSTLATREMVYKPMREMFINRITAPGKQSFFRVTLPYDPDTIRQFERYREESEQRAEAIQKVEQVAGGEEPRSAWRGEKLQPSSEGVAVDTILVPFPSDGTGTRSFVPEPSDARLIPTVSAVNNLKKIALSATLDDPVLLIGETGIGKTSLVRYLASMSQHNFRRFNLSGQTDKTEFIGGYKPDPQGRFRWVEGILIRAMRDGHWLVLDEINLAESQVLERLNSLLDDRYLRVTEHEGEVWRDSREYDAKFGDLVKTLAAQFQVQGLQEASAVEEARAAIGREHRTFRIHPDFRIFATMNPAEYAGRKVLSPALMNRFRVKWMEDEDLSMIEKKLVLLAKFPDRPYASDAEFLNREYTELTQPVRFFMGDRMLDYLDAFHSFMAAMAKERDIGRNERDAYHYSIRDLLRLAKRMTYRVAQQEALAGAPIPGFQKEDILGQEVLEVYADRLRDEADREAVRVQVEGIFGAFQLQEALEVKETETAVAFGEISLPKQRRGGPYVPGESARLALTPTTGRYLKKLAKAAALGEHVLLVGPTGAAKTSYVRHLAHVTGNNFARMNLDAQTDTSELIGQYVPTSEPGVFEWKDGYLVEALKNGYWALLDEINLAEPEILERINSLLDDDASLVLTEHENTKLISAREYNQKVARYAESHRQQGLSKEEAEAAARRQLERERIYPIDPNFRLFAAMNPERYAGRNRLSLAMRNKFTEIWVPGTLNHEELVQLAQWYLGKSLSGHGSQEVRHTAEQMATVHEEVLKAVSFIEDAKPERYPFSVRELRAWARYVGEFAPTLGLTTVIAKGAIYLYYDRLEKPEHRKALVEVLKKLPQAGALLSSQVGSRDVVASRDSVKIKSVVLPVNPNGNRDYVPTAEVARLTLTPTTVQHLEKVAQAARLNEPLLLVGETGVGKTSLIRYLAHVTKNNFRRFNLSGQTEKLEFIGGHQPAEDGSFRWRNGILIEAMRDGHWLVLDEINLAQPQVIERLNSLLDDDGFLVVTEHEHERWVQPQVYDHRKAEILAGGEGAIAKDGDGVEFLRVKETRLYRIHPDFRLFATMNPAEPGYAGRKAFSPALMNRFRVKYIEEMPVEELKAILLERRQQLPPQLQRLITPGLVKQMLRVHEQLRGEGLGLGENKVYFTIRHLLRWMGRIEAGISRGESEAKRLAAVEAKEVYSDGLTQVSVHDPQQRLRLVLDRVLAEVFGGDWRDDRTEITISDGAVSFGGVRLDVNGERSKSVPGPPLAHTASTQQHLKKLAKAVQRREPVLLTGLTGGGKTSFVRHLSDLANADFVTLDLDGQTDVAQLIGQFVPKEGSAQYEWRPGLLLEALENGSWLLIDELNMAEPEILERLNSLLDDDGILVVTEHKGEVYLPARLYDERLNRVADRLQAQDQLDAETARNVARQHLKGKFHRIDPNFRLFAAMNPELYPGRSRLSLAMLNKFHQLWIPEDQPEEEQVVVAGHYLDTAVDTTPQITGSFSAAVRRVVHEAQPYQGIAESRAERLPNPQEELNPPQGPPPGTSGERELQLIHMITGMQMAKPDEPSDQAGVQQEEPRPTGWLGAIQRQLRLRKINSVMRKVELTAKFYGGDFAVKLQPGPEWAISYSTDPPTVVFPERDLEEKSWRYNVAAAMHEGGHRDITWVDPESLHSESDRFLYNAVEDPRVNDWIMAKLKGTRPYLETLYTEIFPMEPKEPFDDRTVLPHIQYGLGLIHHWFHGKEHPAIRNQKVLEVLRRTRDDAVEAYSTLPGSVTVTRTPDRLLIASPHFGRRTVSLPRVGQMFALGEPDVSGIRRLDEETFVLTTARGHEEVVALREGEGRRALINMRPSAAEKVSAAKTVSRIIKHKILPAYRELVEESVRAAGRGLGSGTTPQEREQKAREEVERRSKEAADALGRKIPVDEEKERVVTSDRETPPEGAGKRPRPTPAAPPDKTGRQASEPEPAGAGKDTTIEQPTEVPQAPSAGTDREIEETEPKPPAREIPVRERQRLSIAERIALQEKVHKPIERIRTTYDQYYLPVARLVEQLAGVLDNELHKDIKPRYKGDFTTGMKLNLRKAMTMRKTGDTDIWLRRVKPTRRSFKFSLVLDESGSMGSQEKTLNAVHSLVLAQEVLSRLDIDFSIIGFSESAWTHKGFDRKFRYENRDELISEILAYLNRGQSTNDAEGVALAVEQLDQQEGDAKIAIVITDGRGNVGDIQKELEKARRKQISVIGIGVDPGMEHVQHVYRPFIVVGNVEELPKVLANLLVDIIVHKKFVPESPALKTERSGPEDGLITGNPEDLEMGLIREETVSPKRQDFEVRYAYDPVTRHRFTQDVVGGMAGNVYAFDLSIFAEKVDGKVQVNSTTFHAKLEELVGQLRDVFGEDWQAYVKIVLAHFGSEEDMAALEEAVKQVAPDIAYDRLVAVGSVEQLVETLDETYGPATSKTIVVKDTHVVPPGRAALPELTEPDRPIQVIVVSSPNQAQQEILAGGQAVVLAVEPEFFEQNEELKDLVHWEQWDEKKKVGVLDLEALRVTPEFSASEEVEKKRLEEELARQAQLLIVTLTVA